MHVQVEKELSREELLARLRQSEAALRESEERFRNIADHSPLMMWVTDAAGHCTYLNQVWYSYTGQTEQSGLGAGWLDVVHPEDRPHAEQVFSRAVVDRASFRLDYRLRRQDGEYRWCIDAAAPRFSADGQFLGYVGSVIDITDRKQDEQRLRRNAETFYNLIQNNPFGIYVVDADFRLRQVSLGSQKVFGNVRPLLGRDFAEVLRIIWQEPFATEAIERFRHTLRTGEPYAAASTLERRQDTSDIEAYDWRIERILLPDDRYGVVCYFYDLSERQRWETALRQSEGRFRAMADGLPLIVWVHAADGRQLFVNRTFCEYFGVSHEEMQGGRWTALLHPDDGDAYAREFAACLQERRPFHAETRVRDGQGRWRWVESWGTPRCSETGEYLDYVGCSADITERKEAEFRAKRLFDTDLLGILYWNVFGEITDANDAFLEMVGYAREDLRAGRIDWKAMTPPEFVHLDARALEELRQHGVDTPYEKQFLRKDGSRVRVLVGAALIDESHGVAFTLDVTQRRQVEEALHISQEQLQVALESARLGTWSVNPRTTQVKWDRRARALFGLDEQAEVTVEEAIARIHPDDQQRARQAVEDAVHPASDGNYDSEYRVALPGQPLRWVRAVGRALFEGEGAARRAVWLSGVVLDTTDKRNAAEALREAKEQAERANKTKDDFLAALSHELRTPLTPILISAQGWEDDATLPEELRDDIRMIRRNAQMEARLIDDLLDLTRIARGKLQLHPEPVDLRDVLEQSIRTCRDEARKKELQVKTDLDGTHVQVLGDAARLNQVFCNLIKNAIKFTPEGGRVSICLNRPQRERVEVQVSDTGIGIEPSQTDRIFDAFEQGSQEMTRRFGGLGLGLAICRSLVEMHHGQITAQSDGLGRGATFTVAFPTIDGAVDGKGSARF
jgi:PAS domain S-box-containing protein